MPSFFAYLGASRNSQNVAILRRDLLAFARTEGFEPIEQVVETANRTVPWRERAIGLLLDQAKRGDLILVACFSQLGCTHGEVFSVLEFAAQRGVSIMVAEYGALLDNTRHARGQALAFAVAAKIDAEFARIRSREGLQRARLDGRIGGRRKGSIGRLKLDPRFDEVRMLRSRMTPPKLALHFGVSEKTMRKFLHRHCI